MPPASVIVRKVLSRPTSKENLPKPVRLPPQHMNVPNKRLNNHQIHQMQREIRPPSKNGRVPPLAERASSQNNPNLIPRVQK
jgi:hypothetical protein